MVFAGAGSGKTRVIVYRIANLVATHEAPPYRVLAVTFTNKAAREMRTRLQAIVGDELARDLWVGTFHATCVRMLRQHHEAAGLARSFVVYDDADQRALMTRVVRELGIDDRRFPPKLLLSRVHKEKQEGRGPDDMEAGDFVGEAVVKVFRAYQAALDRASALDFDDILLRVLRVVEDPKSLAGDALRRRFLHVLVDEFQDVNLVQYRLVRALAGAVRQGGSLCVVGDDDQSIYRWRGADVRILRGFRRDFPEATIVKLEQNYRSSGNVVKAALAVIQRASGREPKELWTANPRGALVRVVAADDEHDEAAWVAERIRTLVDGGVSPREIAVFYRTHAQSRVLEEVLVRARLPYQIVGGTKFFDRAEVKDLLAYLRLVANPRSDVDLLRIANVPARKIGATTLERLASLALDRGLCLLDAIDVAVDEDGFGAAARKALAGFARLVRTLCAVAPTLAPADLARRVLADSGYERSLLEQDDAESEARLQNVGELVGSIAEFEATVRAEGGTPTLEDYLASVTLSAAQDDLDEVPKVPLMTVHAAKGLEFHAVFLTGMEEDLFPFRSQDPQRGGDMEEERRLAYVAITRARVELAITHAERRSVFGQTRYGAPSRFIDELPADSVEKGLTASARVLRGRSEAPSARWSAPLSRSASRADPPPRALPASTEPPAPARAPGERWVEREEGPAGLRPGERVHHNVFGVGVVRSADSGSDPTIRVEFPGHGTKSIKARFLRPGG